MDDHNIDDKPPRHAIESDDEDEANPMQPSQPSAPPEVRLVGNIPTGRSLIVASADPGIFWARGADLGEQAGAVAVDGREVGFVFNPSWTQANVIISEALWVLPVSAMHPYAQFTIDNLKPTSVALLDQYSVATLITSDPVPATDAPIRTLSTNSTSTYTPPNLVNSTSASFLSILTITKILGTLVLLPNPNTLKPPPPTLQQRSITPTMEWSSTIMNQAQQIMFQAISEPIDHPWQQQESVMTSAVRRSEIGEGGMYI